jgi:hypothetical protein
MTAVTATTDRLFIRNPSQRVVAAATTYRCNSAVLARHCDPVCKDLDTLL